jgi:hypothetical protein
MLASRVTAASVTGPILSSSSNSNVYFGGVCWKGSLV